MASNKVVSSNKKFVLLVLGYIHMNCIDFVSNESVLKLCYKFIIPEKVIKISLSYYRHRYSIYAIGSNKYEEFGDVNMNIRKSHILHNVNIRGFQKCDEFSHYVSSIDDSIYYGRHRFLIKNHYLNCIYIAGHNNLGQCGVNSHELEIDSFTKLQFNNTGNTGGNIECISSGICSKHTFVIINSNIYAFGSNKDGQFGIDCKQQQPHIYPLELLTLTELLYVSLRVNISQISCGEKHSIFLTKNSGKLLGCGLNDQGQCGIEYDEDYEYILEPEFVELPNNNIHITYISSGREHNLCLDNNGNVWVFGVNTNGELGIGRNKNEYEWIDQPQMIKSHIYGMDNIIIISAGERHSLFIDNSYKIWLCGSNWYNQIGNPNKSFTECQKIPYSIQNNQKLFQNIKFIDASCGDYHTVMLDIANNVYTMGANDSFQCHPPMFNGSDLQKISTPRKIDRKHINIGPYDIITKVLGAASATILIVE